MELLNTTNEELKILSEKIRNFKKHGINKETILDTLHSLLSDNQNLIHFNIKENLYPICLDANAKEIQINIDKLNKTINQSIKYLEQIFPEINNKEMYYYYILYSLTHETRHVFQYLIANKQIQCPYEIIVEVYKNMFQIGNLDTGKINNFISEYLYYLYNERLVLERNANIEGSELLTKLALYEENEPIANVFKQMYKKNLVYGYDDRYNGSIEETYKRLYLKKLYNNLPTEEAIPIKDRIHYGLPINEETKKKILLKY